MTIYQALKKNPVAVRRKGRCFTYRSGACSIVSCAPGSWLAPEALLWNGLLKIEDLKANDWQIKTMRKK